MNKVIAIGNVGKDPEIFTFENGNKRINFSIAVNESYKKKGETEYTTKTDWFNCVAYGHTGEFIEKHVKRGNRISIVGKLRQRSWETDNGTRHAHEVEVNEVEKFDWEKKSGDVAPSNEVPNSQQEPDDLPF